MDQAGQQSPFRLGSRDGRQNERSSPVRVTYKPPAIRLFCLLGFTALFVGCVTSIEWLISKTSPIPTTASAVNKSNSLQVRKLTTITTYNPKDLVCTFTVTPCTMNAAQYSYRSSVAEKIFDDLCCAYTETFAPYTSASLPKYLQAPLTAWTSALSSQQGLVSQLSSDYNPCTFNPTKECGRLWFMYYTQYEFEIKSWTAGCKREYPRMNPPCWHTVAIALNSNGFITTAETLVCGAQHVSQMLITTDVPDSQTAGLNAVAQGVKAIAEVAPFTTSGSTTIVSDSKISPAVIGSHTAATQSDVSSRASSSALAVSASPTTNLYTVNLVQSSSTSNISSILFSSPSSATLSTITSKASLPATRVPSPSQSTSTSIPGDRYLKLVLNKNELIVQRPFTYSTYFVAVFLPAIIAVAIKSLWEIIATSLKLVEPFQRLAGLDGSSAKYSILSQYFESMISLDLLKALSHGRVIPICSALIFVMVEAAPLVGSISMTVKPRKSCLYQGEYRPCDPAWVLNMPLLRLLEAFLLTATTLSMLLVWATRRSRVPIAANPGSIASLAALLNYDPLIRELQKIDPDANGSFFESALTNRLLRLTEHYDPNTEHTRFGFVLSRNHHQKSVEERSSWLPFSREHKGETGYEQIDELPSLRQPHQRSRSRSWSDLSSHRWITISFQFLTTTGLVTLLFTYWFDSNGDDAFNRFFNGLSVPSIVPKVLLVGLAVVVDIQMKYLDRIVRITDPYRRLGMRNARAETTICLSLNGTCWSNLGRNVYLLCRYEFSQGRMLWTTVVSFVACLSDINIIAVTGYLQNIAQTEESYTVCAYLSMTCSAAMFLVVLITMVWWLNVSTIRRMPRQPDTIGHILSYLCGSEMVRDWNSISMSAQSIAYLDQRERDHLIGRDGRRFCFGRMIGTDCKERWCIDYEREQSQVMVVDDVESKSISSVPPIPENWQNHRQQIKRKPIPVRVEVQESGWEPTRAYQAEGREVSRQSRFPSLRLPGQQGWLAWRDVDSDIDHHRLM